MHRESPNSFGIYCRRRYIQVIMTHIDLSTWRVKAEHAFQLKNLATLPTDSETSKDAENDEWPELFQKAADKLIEELGFTPPGPRIDVI